MSHIGSPTTRAICAMMCNDIGSQSDTSQYDAMPYGNKDNHTVVPWQSALLVTGHTDIVWCLPIMIKQLLAWHATSQAQSFTVACTSVQHAYKRAHQSSMPTMVHIIPACLQWRTSVQHACNGAHQSSMPTMVHISPACLQWCTSVQHAYNRAWLTA